MPEAAIDPRLPTQFLPGTPEKIAVLMERAALKIPLAVEGDSQDGSQFTILAEQAESLGMEVAFNTGNMNCRLQPKKPAKQITPEELEKATARKIRKYKRTAEYNRKLRKRWSKASQHPRAPLTLAKQAQRATEEALEAAPA